MDLCGYLRCWIDGSGYLRTKYVAMACVVAWEESVLSDGLVWLLALLYRRIWLLKNKVRGWIDMSGYLIDIWLLGNKTGNWMDISGYFGKKCVASWACLFTWTCLVTCEISACLDGSVWLLWLFSVTYIHCPIRGQQRRTLGFCLKDLRQICVLCV
jgi:hypothetical protein